MLKIFQRTIKDKQLSELQQFRPGCWLYLVDPGDEELQEASKNTGLAKDLLKDALDPFEGPRLETEENITYVFTRAALEVEGQITTTPCLIAIGRDFIATVSREKIPFLEKITQGNINVVTTQRIKFFVQLFSEMNQSYMTFLTSISKRVRSSIVQLEKIENRDIIQFVNYETIINDFLSALIPTNTILHTLLSGRHLKLYEYDEDLVEDLFLSNGQIIEICRSTQKNIVNIRDAYATIMTQDTNRIVKLLTSLTILLTVPTMISSFIGMNVVIPFGESEIAFYWIITLTVIVVAVLMWVFLKRRWL